jgi:hypothetical protein
LGENATIVHGAGLAAVGNFGSAEAGYWHYGSSLKNFTAVLRVLTSLRRGELREWADGGPEAE